MSRYLVTATVSIEIDDCTNADEAFRTFVIGVAPDRTLDGVVLSSVRDAFATDLKDDEDLNQSKTYDIYEREQLV